MNELVVGYCKLLAWHLPNSLQFPNSSMQNFFLYQNVLCSHAVTIINFGTVLLKVILSNNISLLLNFFSKETSKRVGLV